MISSLTSTAPLSPEQLRSERPRLVRLCYRLTGNIDAAEDLAQETLVEALRNAYKLHDPAGTAKWLSAIARNVCLRWNERRGRDLAHRLPASCGDEGSSAEATGLLDIADADYDLDVALDRRELSTLLDRALAMLPAESREVLIERYVRESPYAEIAGRLGLNCPTVRKRLERGRLRLKQLLATHLIHEAAAFGLADHLLADWDQTPIWCPTCGRRHLLGKRMPSGRIWLICKPCDIPVNLYATLTGSSPVQGYSATYLRNFVEHDRRFGWGVAGLTECCNRCGRKLAYRPTVETFGSRPPSRMHYVRTWCERCGDGARHFGVSWQLLSTPEGRRFWQEHPRLRFMPDPEIDAGGAPALLVRAESVTDNARLEGVLLRETFERLWVEAV